MSLFRNAPIGLMAMARNCQFIMVDIDELGKSSLEASTADMKQGVNKVANGEYKPLPCTIFAMGDAQEAMDHMKTGKHTGKIMLTNYEDDERMVKPRRVQASLDHQRCCYKPEGVYLVTGAGGGFGSRIVRHAIMLGARTFVVSLTRDAESRVQALFGDLLQQHSDLAIHAVTADLSVKDDVARLVAVCRGLDQPLRSIIHCAGNPFDKTLHQVRKTSSLYHTMLGPRGVS
jgi:D-arabinose 1-dehydrogenase-like Zn-dependent alcohol dehydrogenase